MSLFERVFIKRFLRTKNGLGRCDHPVVISDPKVKKDSEGRPIVNIKIGCCEFVESTKKIKEK